MGVAESEQPKLVRTNVVLDDKLVREAMTLTGINTKRRVLEEALRTLVQLRKQERIWELYGTVHWQGNLDKMRRARFANGDR